MTWAVDFYIRYITSTFRLSFHTSAGIRDQWTLERFTCQNQPLSSFPCWRVHLSGVCPDDESEGPRPELMHLLSGDLVVCPQSQMLLLSSFRGFGTGVSPSQSPCVKHENEKTYNSVNENRGTGVDSVDVAEQERPFKPYTCLQCNKSCCSKKPRSFFLCILNWTWFRMLDVPLLLLRRFQVSYSEAESYVGSSLPSFPSATDALAVIPCSWTRRTGTGCS